MDDIELVVKIPEEQYDLILKSDIGANSVFVSKECMMYSIKNGTPLPEHHGDLKDIDKLIPDMCETTGCGYQAVSCMQIDLAPTIIPATGNEFFNFDTPIIKKQTAMKECEDKK